MKNKLIYATAIFLLAFCKTNNAQTLGFPGDTILATITADSVVNITATTADIYWNVISGGNNRYVRSGVVIDTLPNPSLPNDAVHDYLEGEGVKQASTYIDAYDNSKYVVNDNYSPYPGTCNSFHKCFSAFEPTDKKFTLTPNKTYYVKAFAINGAGVVYSNQIEFTTLNCSSANASIDSIFNITATTFEVALSISNSGNDPKGIFGFVCDTISNPTYDRNIVQKGSNIKNLHCNRSTFSREHYYGYDNKWGDDYNVFRSFQNNKLKSNTQYYVRPYAINDCDTTYGNEIQIITERASAPHLAMAYIDTITASGFGNIIHLDDSGNDLWAIAYIKYSSTDSLLSDTFNTTWNVVGVSETPIGSFDCGLIPATKYYYQTIVENCDTKILGEIQYFFTKVVEPATITTQPVAHITTTSATLFANGISDGNDNCNLSVGYAININHNPTKDDSTSIVVQPNTYSSWWVDSLNINDRDYYLKPNTTYYVRAFATNLYGTVYGNEIEFNTYGCFAKYTTDFDALNSKFTIHVDSSTAVVAKEYLWDFGDGATGTGYAPKHNYTENGIYNVCMKIITTQNDTCEYCHEIGRDSLGNIYRLSGFSMDVVNPYSILNPNNSVSDTDNLSNIGSQLTKSNIQITNYPNPTNGLSTISFNTYLSKVGLKIYNTNGMQVFEKNNINGNSYSYDISELPSGIYILEVIHNDFKTKVKIIKF